MNTSENGFEKCALDLKKKINSGIIVTLPLGDKAEVSWKKIQVNADAFPVLSAVSE